MTEIWVRHLTLPLLLVVLSKARAASLCFRIDSASSSALRISRFLDHLPFFSIELDFVDSRIGETDSDGNALFYRLESTLSNLAANIDAINAPADDWLPETHMPYAEMWRKLLRAHYIEAVRDELVFFLFLENAWQANHVNQIVPERIIAWLKSDCLAPYTAANLQLRLSVTPQIFPWSGLRGRLIFGWIPGSVIYALAAGLRATFNSRPTFKLPADCLDKGVIFEEYVGHVLKRHEMMGNLFWHGPSGVENGRIVLFINRPDTPLTSETLEEIETHGFSWVDAQDPFAFLTRPVLHVLTVLWRFRSAFPKSFQQPEAWRWTSISYFACLVEAHRSMLSQFNIKLIHQLNEFWPRQIALGIACRMEQVVFLWYHWSVDHFPYAWFDCSYGDLILSWGPHNDGYFRAHGTDFRHLVQVGMIAGDGMADDDSRTAALLRNRLPSSLELVVALFDGSFGRSTRGSKENLGRYYEDCLTMILKNPNWGCFLKSKGDKLEKILDLFPNIRILLEELESAGRCVVVDGQERVSVAARAADIGLGFSINTAGIIGAVSGQRTVYYDVIGAKSHPIVLSGFAENLVYHTIGDLEIALSRVVGGDTEVGNHRQIAPLFDAFLDYQGPQRVGQIIKTFMGHVDHGRKPYEALDLAVHEYAREWGGHLVSSGDEAPAHEGNALWMRSFTESGYPCRKARSIQA